MVHGSGKGIVVLAELVLLTLSAWQVATPDERKAFQARVLQTTYKTLHAIAYHSGRLAIEAEKTYRETVSA